MDDSRLFSINIMYSKCFGLKRTFPVHLPPYGPEHAWCYKALMALAIDWNDETLRDIAKLVVAYLLALPVGWDREKQAHSVGVRTFPLVAMASCGYLLMSNPPGVHNIDAQARVIQGLLAGIGFIGGGAILKAEGNVHGTATAASIFNTGVVGAAVATDRYWLALLLAALNLFTLRVLWPLKQRLDRRNNGDQKSAAIAPPLDPD
jgi:putative Mg2+ transporter-C (MgtC) family protein